MIRKKKKIEELTLISSMRLVFRPTKRNREGSAEKERPASFYTNFLLGLLPRVEETARCVDFLIDSRSRQIAVKATSATTSLLNALLKLRILCTTAL